MAQSVSGKDWYRPPPPSSVEEEEEDEDEIPPLIIAVNCEEFQSEELQALDAYYGNDRNVFVPSEKPADRGGDFQAFVELNGAAMTVKMKRTNDSSVQEYIVHHLPPVHLTFTLPPTYPMSHPPVYTICCSWLSQAQLAFVCDALDRTWDFLHNEYMHGYDPRGVLLYWTFCLREHLLHYLNLDLNMYISVDEIAVDPQPSRYKWESIKELRGTMIPVDEILKTCMTPYCSLRVHDSRGQTDGSSTAQLLEKLLDYDREQRREAFYKKRSYECTVCYEEKKATECMPLDGCDHVFCRDCLIHYSQEQISQGNISNISCLEPSCTGQVHPNQLTELLDDDWMERFYNLGINTAIAEMDDLRHCPRPGCGHPVIVDMKNGVGICDQCEFPFCIHCNKTYHGVQGCDLNSQENKDLLQRYMSSTSSQKQELEKKHSRRFIKMLQEEHESSSWLEENSKKCPSCHVYVQKEDGCNKMTCHNCRSYFCWLCGEKIPKDSPYKHFNSLSGQPCSNRLFEGAEQQVMDYFQLENIEEANRWDLDEAARQQRENDGGLRIVEVIRNDNKNNKKQP